MLLVKLINKNNVLVKLDNIKVSPFKVGETIKLRIQPLKASSSQEDTLENYYLFKKYNNTEVHIFKEHRFMYLNTKGLKKVVIHYFCEILDKSTKHLVY